MLPFRERFEELVLTGVISLAVFAACLFLPDSLWSRAILLFGVVFGSYTYGALLDRSNRVIPSLFYGFFAVIATQSIIQTILYYASFSLGAFTDGLSLALSLVFLQVITLFLPEPTPLLDEPEHLPIPWTVSALVAGACAALFAGLSLSFRGTMESIRTPWPLLAEGTLLSLTGLGGLAWIAGNRLKKHWLPLVFLCAGLGLVAALAPLVYQLGFGFDGFLHRASEQVLLSTGTLTPKPPYYIGFYVLVTWFARLFSISVARIDPWVAPVLLACLPLFVWRAFSQDRRGLLVAGLMACLPLAGLVGGTPQTVAYILGLFALATALGTRERHSAWPLPCLLMLWALMVHPLAGLPLAGATVGILLLSWRERTIHKVIPTILTILAGISTIISVPIAFYVNSLRSQAAVSWHLGSLLDQQGLSRFFGGMTALPLNHVALWADVSRWLLFFFPIALFGLASIAIVKDRERRSYNLLFLLTAFGTVLAGCFLRLSGDFTFLIDYERGNFADRLFVIAQLLLLFPALQGLGFYTERLLRTRSTIIASAFFVLLLGWQASLMYHAYPTHDAAQVGRGWSVGSADFEAVRFIEQNAQGAPYTVLANQTVSAAAVATYGFKRYVNDVFYYPIPTGGPLYEVFLRAVGTEPTRDTMQEAARLGESKIVYVVLNQYWWDFDRVNDALTTIADRVQPFGNGAVMVYRFDMN